MLQNNISCNKQNDAECDYCLENDCSKTAYQYADISIPMELRPEIKMTHIETECYGEPTVIHREKKCDEKCEIMIIQKVCIKIPIEYSIVAHPGEGCIKCNCE